MSIQRDCTGTHVKKCYGFTENYYNRLVPNGQMPKFILFCVFLLSLITALSSHKQTMGTQKPGMDCERFEQSGHYNEAAFFIWIAALDWWEWASRYTAGEPSGSIEQYKIVADSIGKRYGLTSLRVARINNPDPEKNRLGALSYLFTARSFAGKQIEEKLGLQTRYLFEFALEAQYLRSRLTDVDPKELENFAKKSGIPESYWKKIITLSPPAEHGSLLVTSAILKMNQEIEDYLAELRTQNR